MTLDASKHVQSSGAYSKEDTVLITGELKERGVTFVFLNQLRVILMMTMIILMMIMIKIMKIIIIIIINNNVND